MKWRYILALCNLAFNGLMAQYCIPTISGPAPTPQIGLTYYELNTASNTSTAAIGFSDSSHITTTLVKGRSYDLIANWQFGNSQNFAAWIDYNIDSIFTTNELIHSVENPFSPFFFPAINKKITVPIDSKTGITKLRLASNDTSNLCLNAGSCIEMHRGEVEDYGIILKDTQYVNSIQPYWGNVAKGETNEVILGLELIFTDPTLSLADLTLQNILCRTTGSTNPNNDILNAKLWYTDTVNNLNCHPNPLLLGTITSVDDTLDFLTNQVILSAKKNYFWLTYDISSTSNIGNLLDATIEEINVGGNIFLPDSSSRIPFRRIDTRRSYYRNEANIWTIDQEMGIDFNWETPAFVSSIHQDFACSPSEGLGNICNASGELLFYTDACNVFDQCHNLMPNGTDIIGLSSHTQGLTIKKPGGDNLFYILTFMTADNPSNPLTAESSLLYSIVDMNLNNGRGDVIQKNIPLLDSVLHEMVAVIDHCNGIDKWIITGIWSRNEYHAFLLTENGIEPAIVSNPTNGLMFDDGFVFASRGALKASPDGTKLAGIMQHAASTLQLFDFDDATGMVSNAIPLHADDNGMALTFSPNSSKLYIGQESGGRVFQYDLCATDILASRKLIGQTAGFSIHFLQNGPDGKIYFPGGALRNYLSVIEFPDSTNPNFIDNGLFLGGYTKFSSLIFTSGFNESYFNSKIPYNNIGFNYTYTCNDSVRFEDTTLYLPNCNQETISWHWNFGDGQFSNLQNPNHLYATEGLYNVEFIISYNCQSDTIEMIIDVSDSLAISIEQGPDTSICFGDSILISALAGSNYSWSPNVGISSSSGNSIFAFPSTTTTYTVNGTSACGPSSDTVRIRVNPLPVVTTSNDTAICLEDTAYLYVTGGINYNWTPETGLSNSSIDNPLAFPSSTTKYKVTIDNGICSVIDSVIVTLLPLPNINLDEEVTIYEGESTFLEASGNGNISWSPINEVSCIFCNATEVSPPQTMMFYALLTDSNECSITDSILVNVISVNQLYFPSALTLNKDNINEYWKVYGTDIKEITVHIFDRWGYEIYTSSNLNDSWDGTINGKPLPQGVYVARINAIFNDNTVFKESGKITLIK